MAADVDPLERLLGAAEASDTTQLHVVYRGAELADLDGRTDPLDTASITKLIVGTTLGRAVRLRLLDLDDPIHRWFPEWVSGPKAGITVRHVMGHMSGLTADTWAQLDASAPPDMLAYVLNDLPMVAEPGKTWAHAYPVTSGTEANSVGATGVFTAAKSPSARRTTVGLVGWWRIESASLCGSATSAT